ncbi:MAG: ABC transporter permease subunit [Calditerrivibrio sp.]|nr:ABC transporter permease subunit [Calditerrivibrio sp.]
MRDKNFARRAIDSLAKYLITVGGIGTIVAVLLVFLFLTYTVIPLFKSGEVSDRKSVVVSNELSFKHAVVDEYGLLGVVFDGKSFSAISMFNGEILTKFNIDGEIIGYNFNSKDDSYTISDSKGRLMVAKMNFGKNNIKSGDTTGNPNYSIRDGKIVEIDGDAESEYSVDIKVEEILQKDYKIVLVDSVSSENSRFLAFLDENKVLHIDLLSSKENMLTGEISQTIDESLLDMSGIIGGSFPKYLKINSSKTNIMLFFEDSRFINVDTKNFDNPFVLEDKKLFNDGRKITYLDFLIGRNTILVGDDKGNLTTWWSVESSLSKNNFQLTNIHTFSSGDETPVRFIYPSKRDKSFLVLNESNTISLYHMTSGKKLFQTKLEGINSQIGLMNQKNNKIFVIGKKNIAIFDINIPHPEVTFKSIFGKVQYELTNKPEHVWQSSSGSDDFEPKFGLMPLIFGTIKGTIIAMIFAVPIAIMGAIYTSEFAHKRYRNSIKSTIEVMASLPSVVLGFIAALIVSPFVENIVLGLIFCIIMIPFSLIFMGHLSQLLPKNTLNAMDRYRLLGIAIIGIPFGIFLGMKTSVIAEKLFFYGDFKLWLHTHSYSPIGGWALILLPAGIFVTMFIYRKFLYDFYISILDGKSYTICGLIEIIKFFILTIASVFVSFLFAAILTKIGIDLRFGLPVIESIMSTYVQRNALIVGFIMGFAVIPIIYTVSEDALNAVPEHLRSASLATGATQWQTVVNIILPVAMSGIFSAVMIGFGRAIGETMIVLMAAGNTPIMDMNIFSGFRTLSANIAVELPEAVIGSTHYRILYLAALVLFVMTFIINTIAELVRIRYRKRSSQL